MRRSLWNQYTLPPTLQELFDANAEQLFFTLLQQNATDVALHNFFRPAQVGVLGGEDKRALVAPQRRSSFASSTLQLGDRMYNRPFISVEETDADRLTNIGKTVADANGFEALQDATVSVIEQKLQKIMTAFCESAAQLGEADLLYSRYKVRFVMYTLASFLRSTCPLNFFLVATSYMYVYINC